MLQFLKYFNLLFYMNARHLKVRTAQFLGNLK